MRLLRSGALVFVYSVLSIDVVYADDLTFAVTVSSALKTSDLYNGSSGNLEIDYPGSVSISSAGAAVTIDSDNTVVNYGTIYNTAATGGIGVLLTGGGSSAAFTNYYGVYVSGGTGPNTGILVDSAGFAGDITLASGSNMGVSGAGSTGISIEGAWTGTLSTAGTITVSGNGVTGVSISADAASSTFVNSGTINTIGTYLSSAATTDATAISFGSGNTLPSFTNSGIVEASTSGYTTGTATGILLASGSTLTSLVNAGTISATAVTGHTGATSLYAYGIRDLSGNLTDITNFGYITASATTLTNGQQAAVAADLSAGTSAVTFSNWGTITGDVKFGSGGSTFALHGGTVTGNVSFEGGANQISIDGGARFSGMVAMAGGTVGLTVTSGTFETPSTRLTSLDVASGGTILFNIGGTTTSDVITTTGDATFAAGSQIGFTFNGMFPESGTYTLLSSGGTLSFADSSTYSSVTIPWLYTGSMVQSGNDLDFTFQRKTAAQLGLTGNIAALYVPALEASQNDSSLGAAMLSLATDAQVSSAIAQLMPDLTGATRQAAIAATDRNLNSVGGHQKDLIFSDPGRRSTFWGQEATYSLSQSGAGDIDSVHGSVQSFAFGFDAPASPGARYGLAFSLNGNTLKEDGNRLANTAGDWYLLTPYANWKFGDFFVTGQGNLGYGDFKETRTVNIGSVTRTAGGQWSSYLAAGGLSTGVVLKFAGLSLVPEAGLDGMFVRESGYSEDQGGAGVELSLNGRDETSLRGTVGFSLNDKISLSGVSIVPTLRGAWSHDLVSNAGTVSGSFASVSGSSSDFTFDTLSQATNRFTAGAGIGLEYPYWSVRLDYDTAFAKGEKAQRALLHISGLI